MLIDIIISLSLNMKSIAERMDVGNDGSNRWLLPDGFMTCKVELFPLLMS